jgi:hypothetical protein
MGGWSSTVTQDAFCHEGDCELICCLSFRILITNSPQSDHPAHYIANEMAYAHNAMIRGLNAIYLQAPHVPQECAEDFLFLISSWCTWVMHHHNMEESAMFPGFESVSGVIKGSLQGNIDQHHAFSDGLETLHRYATTTPPSSLSFSGERIQAHIDNFAKPFHEHLTDEIETLWAMDSVAADSSASQKLLKIYKECEANAGRQDKFVVPPMVLGLCDRTFEGGNNWPVLPTGATYIVHYILGGRHRGAWRFLPSDSWRNPRPLQFLGEKTRPQEA